MARNDPGGLGGGKEGVRSQTNTEVHLRARTLAVSHTKHAPPAHTHLHSLLPHYYNHDYILILIISVIIFITIELTS